MRHVRGHDATAFDVLAEPNRRRILDSLRDGERPVGELVHELRLSQPAVSKHLRALREAGLVEVRPGGAAAVLPPPGGAAAGARRLDRALPALLGPAPRRPRGPPRHDGGLTMEITDEVRSRMGTATITDGTWTLTFVRHLDHPVEKVWRADHRVRAPGGLVPVRHRRGAARRAPTSRMPFWPDVVEKYEVAEPDTKGHIEVWEPPTRFELRWEGDHLRWELEPTATGTTLTADDRHRGPRHRHRRGRRLPRVPRPAAGATRLGRRRHRWPTTRRSSRPPTPTPPRATSP